MSTLRAIFEEEMAALNAKMKSRNRTTKPHPEDVCIWPCGTWCYRSELNGFSFMSDDHLIVAHDSLEAELVYDTMLEGNLYDHVIDLIGK